MGARASPGPDGRRRGLRAASAAAALVPRAGRARGGPRHLVLRTSPLKMTSNCKMRSRGGLRAHAVAQHARARPHPARRRVRRGPRPLHRRAAERRRARARGREARGARGERGRVADSISWSARARVLSLVFSPFLVEAVVDAPAASNERAPPPRSLVAPTRPRESVSRHRRGTAALNCRRRRPPSVCRAARGLARRGRRALPAAQEGGRLPARRRHDDPHPRGRDDVAHQGWLPSPLANNTAKRSRLEFRLDVENVGGEHGGREGRASRW